MITLKEFLAEPQTMYDGGVVQHMSEGGEPTETLKMSVFDEEYDEYLKNLEGSTSNLFNDNVMRDVLDSFSVSSKSLEEVNPKELSLPIPEKRLDLYKKLELEPPSSKEGALTVGSLDWYKDYNLLAPPMTYEQLLKRRYGLEPIDLDWDVSHIIERPSSSTVTEQQLPVTTKPTLPVPKSLKSKLPRIVGTILKARKYTNPLGIASQVLDLIPQETKTAAVDYLKNTPAYELFGLEHYDLEYWKALGDMVNDVLDTGINQDEYGVDELWSEFQHYLGLLHEEEVAIEAEPTSLLELPDKQIETGPTEEINAEYVRNLALYHATTATKLIGGKLKASKVGVLGQGVYATPDTEYAGGYAEGEGGNIHPVKANIENPLIVRIKGRFHDYTPARVFEELGVSKEKAYEMAERNNEEHGGDFTTQFKSRARKQGYDSIVLVNDETNTMQEIVVFDPDKIVSKFRPMYDGGLVLA